MASVFASQKFRFWLAIVVLVAAGAVGLPQLFRRPPIKGDINFVCAETGERFALDRDKVVSVPAENPKTHETTLLPCYLDHGVLKVSPRYRQQLQQLGEKNRYVDPQTLAVKTSP
jgi:hypothetical protein